MHLLAVPQAFLTGTLQNYARRHGLPIDTVSFTYEVMDQLDLHSCTSGPPEGCYIRGLFMEGARWDVATHKIGECMSMDRSTPARCGAARGF